MSSTQQSGGGLSLQTLVIASASSLAAALFIHKFWQAGAVWGAAVTPVIVALVSEGLRKPAEAISARTGRTAVNPPPVVTPRDDRFGIWEEQRRRRPLHVQLAIGTGLIAFLIAAVFLTGAELVLGGASDSDRLRVIPGKQERKESRQSDQAPTSTQPGQAAPAPDEEEEAPPAETAPEETTPEETVPEEDAPPEAVPPAETLPQPDPGATTP